MKRLYIATVISITALLALSFWKNTFSYRSKSVTWRVTKSVIDSTIVILAAWYLPALLIGWVIAWLTRFIGSRGIQVTLAVIAGIIFHSIGGVYLEVVCVFGIWAVDLLTGAQGIYGWWRKGPPDQFLPSLKREKA